jgi:hypothetical protein
MIERFNFYDVYGYLIPGAVLAGVIWIPHALVQLIALPADLTSAVVAIVVAYVAGHVLQIVAAKVVPATQPFPTGQGVVHRYPSDRLLDDDDTTLAPKMKRQLIELIQRRFPLDVNLPTDRATAFLLCRNSVIAGKTASYVEQFQGMYVLMRGIASAAAIGCAYDLGWLWGPFIARREVVASVLAFLTIAAIAAGFRWTLPSPRRALPFAVLFLLSTFAAGSLASEGAARHTGLLSATACLSLLVALWSFGSYRAFTRTWAQTVYQHFYLSQTVTPEEKPSPKKPG